MMSAEADRRRSMSCGSSPSSPRARIVSNSSRKRRGGEAIVPRRSQWRGPRRRTYVGVPVRARRQALDQEQATGLAAEVLTRHRLAIRDQDSIWYLTMQPVQCSRVRGPASLCGKPPVAFSHPRLFATAGDDLAEQTAQETSEHHRQAVVAAAAAFCSSRCLLERRHRVKHDPQVMFTRDLTRSLAEAE
jgi:hypothetical protein